MRFFYYCLPVIFLLFACQAKTAQIWTDRPEFALYGEYFNTMQNQYKVTVRYYEFPAAELRKTDTYPDIIVGSWLKNTSTGIYFRALDNLFGEKKMAQTIFYEQLLAVGKIEKNQYLLPVSFNIPALIFIKEKEQSMSNSFTVDFEEIQALSGKFNIEKKGIYTRMGFSPLWDNDFLYITAALFGASFTEADPLVWDNPALEGSIDFIINWINTINTNIQAEDEFTFKYFFEPPAKLIQSGRILFSYMDSSALFTLNEDNMDFRWIAGENKIPLNEAAVYMGVPKKAKSPKAAAAFIRWFFNVDTQRKIMEECKANRINETVFGVCGGFSALSTVTEQIFPRFYPDLLGRMPPSEYLIPSAVLPENWVTLKERVILPYLNDRVRKNANEAYSLEKRLIDWQRISR
jgi:ABC-type glycerol-3-phosphate transport system substrate-binding protein